MKLASVIPAIKSGLLPAISAAAAGPINTPSPMQNGPYEHCEGFFQASPGMTCDHIATSQALSLKQFIAINPQIDNAGGCEQDAIEADYWYCIKPYIWPSEVHDGLDPVPGDKAGQNPGARPTEAPSPDPAPKPSPPTSPSPEPSPQPSPTTSSETTPFPSVCSIDDCWRAFKLARYGARRSQSAWCTEFMDGSCDAEDVGDIDGVPNLVGMQCTQGPACEVISTACACYTQGSMDLGKDPNDDDVDE